MRRRTIDLDLRYRPFEVSGSDGEVHKLRYYVENDIVHLAGTPKKAVLRKVGEEGDLDPEGLARLLAQDWLKEQAMRSKRTGR